jgi:geranylgeranyl diphosphate synthase type II
VSSYPEALRDQVERYLAALRFPSVAPQTAGLEEAMRYSLLAGGKRIRPVLALATARAIGREPADILPLAAAIELIHTYSLIHDDLPAMDDDDLRRGRPTCHVKFGEDVAILAGDGLYAEAFRHLLTEQAGDATLVLAAARELAAATGVDGMVGGQYLDVAGVGDVLLLAGMEEGETTAWRRFAAELGVLFQIVDDILDVTGTDAALGKPSGSDERMGKRTYVSHFGLDGARDLARQCHESARAALREAAATGAAELEQITDFILTRTA